MDAPTTGVHAQFQIILETEKRCRERGVQIGVVLPDHLATGSLHGGCSGLPSQGGGDVEDQRRD